MRFDMRLACACEDTAPLPGVRLPGVQRPEGGGRAAHPSIGPVQCPCARLVFITV